jgi:hypothetical protein
MHGIADFLCVAIVAAGLGVMECFWPGLLDEDSG